MLPRRAGGLTRMTVTRETLPKEAKALPPEAQDVYVAAYNQDFGWRCSESHADKAAWIAVRRRWPDLKA